MKPVIVMLAIVCSLSGCSVAGYTVGSVMDSEASDLDTLTSYSRLDPGDIVIVHRKDGRINAGTVAEPLQHLSFDQKVAKISGPSAPTFDLTAGSISNSMVKAPGAPTTLVLIDDRISTDSIQFIVTPHKKHAAFTGLILGGAMDIAVAAIIVSQMPFFKGLGFGRGR